MGNKIITVETDSTKLNKPYYYGNNKLNKSAGKNVKLYTLYNMSLANKYDAYQLRSLHKSLHVSNND